MCISEEHGMGENSVGEREINEILDEVDDELNYYDDNNDGYIFYSEFMRNHKQRIAELQESDY